MTAKLSVWYACWGGKQHLVVADKCNSFLMSHVMAYMERWPIKRKKEVEILQTGSKREEENSDTIGFIKLSC